MTVSMRVMSAGDGYKYLLKTVVAADESRQVRACLDGLSDLQREAIDLAARYLYVHSSALRLTLEVSEPREAITRTYSSTYQLRNRI